MNRPAFQFYPNDWRGNAKLRRCSEAARGAWIDILCTLHDSDEYGVCRWPLRDLARAAGVSMRSIKELVANGVLKGADRDAEPFTFAPFHAGKHGDPVTLVEVDGGSVWYSSRLVHDEFVRQRRGNGTQFTAEHQPPKPPPKTTPKPTIGERQGDGASASVSSSSSSRDQEISAPKRPRRPSVEFSAWLSSLGEADAIPADDPIFDYASKAGIPNDFLELSWQRFVQAMRESDTRKKDWRAHYRNSVRGNWYKLWWAAPDGTLKLTTVGEQARRAAA